MNICTVTRSMLICISKFFREIKISARHQSRPMINIVTKLSIFLIVIAAELSSQAIISPYSVKCPSSDLIRTANVNNT